MKQIYSFFLLTVILFTGCTKDFQKFDIETKPQIVSVEQNAIMRADFGESLVKALSKNESLRKFIKTESLKQFDNDYDVLYAMVANAKVDGVKTFRDILQENFDNKDRLNEIEQKLPLLTILVPELPENSFSASAWDATNQIPEVGVALSFTNNVLMYKPNGTYYHLGSNIIPNFPVVVIKENERVGVIEELSNNSSFNGRRFDIGIVHYQFLDDCFDAELNNSKSASRISFNLDQKLKDAYNIYNGVDGWQRDYIYYNITPANPNGPFSLDYKESITMFRLNGDPTIAYNKISDAAVAGAPINMQDPRFNKINMDEQNVNAHWTEGNFEFSVKTVYNSNSGAGTENTTYFGAYGYELFDLELKTISVLGSYTIASIKSVKELPLNLQIFNWNLSNYSTEIKISIAEEDATVQTTVQQYSSAKYVTNFGIDFGVTKKIGLKAGITNEATSAFTYTQSYTQGRDDLGEVTVHFGDKVVLNPVYINTQQAYNIREYGTGFYSISVEPRRVQ